MNMIYKENTLYIDLNGEVDIEKIRVKLFNVASQFNFNNVVISVGEVFNYKKRVFNTLIKDYTKLYNGKIKIVKN